MWKVVDCVESCQSGGDQWIGLKVVGWAESCCKVGVSEGNKMRDFWNFMKHRQPTTFHISPEKIMFFFKLYENQPTIDNKQHVFADARHNIKSTPPNQTFRPKGAFSKSSRYCFYGFRLSCVRIHYAAGRAGWRTVARPTVLLFRRASAKVSNQLIPCSKYGARISKWFAQALYQSDILRFWDVGRLDKRSEFGCGIPLGPPWRARLDLVL